MCVRALGRHHGTHVRIYRVVAHVRMHARTCAQLLCNEHVRACVVHECFFPHAHLCLTVRQNVASKSCAVHDSSREIMHNVMIDVHMWAHDRHACRVARAAVGTVLFGLLTADWQQYTLHTCIDRTQLAL